MGFIIPDDMPIDIAYKKIRAFEIFYDKKYRNKVIKCDCGVRKNEEEFRNKLVNDVEHWKGKVAGGEREQYYNNGENSDDGYFSGTTVG